jgi:hypothetical protein
MSIRSSDSAANEKPCQRLRLGLRTRLNHAKTSPATPKTVAGSARHRPNSRRQPTPPNFAPTGTELRISSPPSARPAPDAPTPHAATTEPCSPETATHPAQRRPPAGPVQAVNARQQELPYPKSIHIMSICPMGNQRIIGCVARWRPPGEVEPPAWVRLYDPADWPDVYTWTEAADTGSPRTTWTRRPTGHGCCQYPTNRSTPTGTRPDGQMETHRPVREVGALRG